GASPLEPAHGRALPISGRLRRAPRRPAVPGSAPRRRAPRLAGVSPPWPPGRAGESGLLPLRTVELHAQPRVAPLRDDAARRAALRGASPPGGAVGREDDRHLR